MKYDDLAVFVVSCLPFKENWTKKATRKLSWLASSITLITLIFCSGSHSAFWSLHFWDMYGHGFGIKISMLPFLQTWVLRLHGKDSAPIGQNTSPASGPSPELIYLYDFIQFCTKHCTVDVWHNQGFLNQSVVPYQNKPLMLKFTAMNGLQYLNLKLVWNNTTLKGFSFCKNEVLEQISLRYSTAWTLWHLTQLPVPWRLSSALEVIHIIINPIVLA